MLERWAEAGRGSTKRGLGNSGRDMRDEHLAMEVFPVSGDRRVWCRKEHWNALRLNGEYHGDWDAKDRSRRRPPESGNAMKPEQHAFAAMRTFPAAQGMLARRSLLAGIRLGVLCWRMVILQCQLQLNVAQETTVSRSPQSVVADLVKSPRQDVLKKASDELFTRKTHGLPLAMTRILVAKGHNHSPESRFKPPAGTRQWTWG